MKLIYLHKGATPSQIAHIWKTYECAKPQGFALVTKPCKGAMQKDTLRTLPRGLPPHHLKRLGDRKPQCPRIP